MRARFLLIAAVLGAVGAGCTGAEDSITVYSGRSEQLVGPVIERFEKASGIDAKVRYGDTAELAAAILEEAASSPADVFFAQDAGALGAVDNAGRFARLPDALLRRVPEPYRSPDGRWVGVTGRVRVVVYNTDAVKPAGLPRSILEFTDPRWTGKIGWAPTNGSFQAFVTALRLGRGEDVARNWLEGIKTTQPRSYPNNDAITEAVAAGEIEVGFVNHYYPLEIGKGRPDFKAAVHYFEDADPGGLVNVAGAGVLRSSKRVRDARAFLTYLLSRPAQQYFAEETFEYPLVDGVAAHPSLRPLGSLNPPSIDLSALADLEGTLELLRRTGVL